MSKKLSLLDKELIVDLYRARVIKVGTFRLRVGEKAPYSYLTTPFLIDVRVLVSYPTLLKRVARRYVKVLESLQFHRMVGIPYASLPIVAAISMINNEPWIYPRREVKDYGTKNEIEGEYNTGELVVLVDDTVTTGDTLVVTIDKLRRHKLRIEDIVLLVDRGEKGIPALRRRGYNVHALYHIDDILGVLFETGNITKKQLLALNKDHMILQQAVVEAKK